MFACLIRVIRLINFLFYLPYQRHVFIMSSSKMVGKSCRYIFDLGNSTRETGIQYGFQICILS